MRSKDLLEAFPTWNVVLFKKWLARRKPILKVQSKHILDVYLYEDEAGFFLDGKNWTIFEKPDYSSSSELLNAFLTHLRAKLTSDVNP